MKLIELNIKEAHKGLIEKKFSSVELTKAFLDRIEKTNKKINSFLTITKDLALKQAKEVDNLISKKEKIGILAGIPLAVKDIILVEGVKCTAASKILENYIASYDATVIERLKKNKCVILGKTNLDEFAMGASTENSAFGPTKNPRDLTCVPGGSSGGSSAAVAGNQCVYALGSDTGGSVRQPSSFCGVVGLKPTYGSVSRYGLMAYSSSLDQIGPITKTVEDAKIVLEVISGKDEMDSSSFERKNKPKEAISINNLVIGVPKEYFGKGIDLEVKNTVKQAIEKYRKAGAKIKEISLPYTKYAVPAYYIISPSEASSNLARYDGIRYGNSRNKDKKIKNLLDLYLQNRGQGFGKEVKRRIMIGTYSLSSGYYDAYYLRAQKVRNLIKQDFVKALNKVDVIMTSTTPSTAFKLGEKSSDPLLMYLADVFTAGINLAGNPAISIPCGSLNKLPVGLQIIGRHFEEDKILEVGKIFEKL